METASSGRLALETRAPDALDALSTVEATAWSSAGRHDTVDLVDLLARVVAGAARPRTADAANRARTQPLGRPSA